MRISTTGAQGEPYIAAKDEKSNLDYLAELVVGKGVRS